MHRSKGEKCVMFLLYLFIIFLKPDITARYTYFMRWLIRYGFVQPGSYKLVGFVKNSTYFTNL